MSSNVSNQNPVEQVAEVVQVAPTDQELSLVAVENEHAVTTSLRVAEVFGKQHKDVLKAVKSLDCSEEFRERNFALSKIDYQNGNIKKQLPMYYITRDGFMFLVMGFTGKTAAKWKEAYIKAFNDMEAKIRAEQMQRAIEEHDRKEAEEYDQLLKREQREEAEVDRRVDELARERAKQEAQAQTEPSEQPTAAEQQPIVEVLKGKRVITSRTLARLTGRNHGDMMYSIQRMFKYADRPGRMFIKSDRWAANPYCGNSHRFYYITIGGFALMCKRTRSISSEVHKLVLAAFGDNTGMSREQLALPFKADKPKTAVAKRKHKTPTTPPKLTEPQTAQAPTVATMPQTPADLMQRFVKAMGVMMGVDTKEMFNLMDKGE